MALQHYRFRHNPLFNVFHRLLANCCFAHTMTNAGDVTSLSSSSFNNTSQVIPFELVSEEEMALIEAALSAATASLPSSSSSSSLLLSSTVPSMPNQRNRTHLTQCSFNQTNRELSGCSEEIHGPIATPHNDIEDLGRTQKRIKVPKSLFDQFRRRRGLSVTDITASEWCEKQIEFVLIRGRPEKTAAMKVGSTRHTELEEEVVKKVDIHVQSAEDSWAVKFMNFISGTNQLLFEGLTRELPLVGFVEGVWMVGVIDEIRMPITEGTKCPSLVDTKTRYRATPPSEAQKRNGRLQLMCYKYLWDATIADNFPTSFFFKFFGLNPRRILSREVREFITSSGFDAKTLDDLVGYYRSTCYLLPPAHEQLLLRYELQADCSLLEEYRFKYDDGWVKSQVQWYLKFWLGQREAGYALEDERWKCSFCSFSAACPLTQLKSGAS